MTEGNGHVIDPAGVARRARQAAVAEHGPLVLSDPGIMDRIGRQNWRAARRGHPHRQRGPDRRARAAPRADPPAGQLRRDPVSRRHPGRSALAGAGGVRVGGARVRPRAGPHSARRDSDGGRQRAAAGRRRLERRRWPGRGWRGRAGRNGNSAGESGGGPQAPGPPPSGAPPSGPPPPRARRPGRNALGIAAAIALIVVYLGVAAIAHLSPFPAKAAAATCVAGREPGQCRGGNPGRVIGRRPRPGSRSPVGVPDLAEHDPRQCPGPGQLR